LEGSFIVPYALSKSTTGLKRCAVNRSLSYTEYPIAWGELIYHLGIPGQGHFVLRPRVEGNLPKAVLVADDHLIIRQMLYRLFELEEGYSVCAQATNGQEAIELALGHRPELIILDFSMPVLNGLEAARELKKLLPGVPIILFTQFSDFGSALSDDHKNVDRIVLKTNVPQLMEHVHSLLPV
jgi:CheY-like chemotaxis protein